MLVRVKTPLCQTRPADVSAKQWLANKGIQEKTYYYWQRKSRREACEQIRLSAATTLGILKCTTEEFFSVLHNHQYTFPGITSLIFGSSGFIQLCLFPKNRQYEHHPIYFSDERKFEIVTMMWLLAVFTVVR